MKKLLKYMSMICLFVCILSLSGCFSAEQRERGREIESAAKSAVEAYLPEKYGFEAKITSVRAIYGVDLIAGGRYHGDTIVTCEYQEKTFEVHVVGDGVIGDNYQREAIIQDIGPFVQSQFSHKSHVVTQRLAVNLFVVSPLELIQEHWTIGYWGKDQFYDGNMEGFIGNMSEPDKVSFVVTLLFGVVANNKEVAMQQLMQEAEDLQTLAKNNAYITLALYDADKFTDNDVNKAIQDDNIFSLNLLSEFSNNESIVRVYDYFSYSSALGNLEEYNEKTGYWTEVDFIDVCGYTVNGNSFEIGDRLFFTDIFNESYAERTDGATTLTAYFGTSSIANHNNDFYPDHRYVRVNVVKRFPQEAAANKEFVVLDAYETSKDSRKPVLIVPSLRIEDYLYFDCVKYHDYAIGIRG